MGVAVEMHGPLQMTPPRKRRPRPLKELEQRPHRKMPPGRSLGRERARRARIPNNKTTMRKRSARNKNRPTFSSTLGLRLNKLFLKPQSMRNRHPPFQNPSILLRPRTLARLLIHKSLLLLAEITGASTHMTTNSRTNRQMSPQSRSLLIERRRT